MNQHKINICGAKIKIRWENESIKLFEKLWISWIKKRNPLSIIVIKWCEWWLVRNSNHPPHLFPAHFWTWACPFNNPIIESWAYLSHVGPNAFRNPLSPTGCCFPSSKAIWCPSFHQFFPPTLLSPRTMSSVFPFNFCNHSSNIFQTCICPRPWWFNFIFIFNLQRILLTRSKNMAEFFQITMSNLLDNYSGMFEKNFILFSVCNIFKGQCE